jgi:hypothetical protein
LNSERSAHQQIARQSMIVLNTIVAEQLIQFKEKWINWLQPARKKTQPLLPF